MKILSFFLLSTLAIFRAACYSSYKICDMDYSPVCASDGKTYSNQCLMLAESKKLIVLYHGPCNEGKILSPLKNFEDFNEDQENEVHPLNNPKYTNMKNYHLTFAPNNQNFNHNGHHFEQKFVHIMPKPANKKEISVHKQHFYFSLENELNYAPKENNKRHFPYKKKHQRDKKKHPNDNNHSTRNTNLHQYPERDHFAYKSYQSLYKPDSSVVTNKPDNSPYKPDNSPYKPYHSAYKPGDSLYKPDHSIDTAYRSSYKLKQPHELDFLSNKPGRSTYTIQLKHEHNKPRDHHHEKDNVIYSFKPYSPNIPYKTDCSPYKSNYNMVKLLRRLLGLMKVLVKQHKTVISLPKPDCTPYSADKLCKRHTNSLLGISLLSDSSDDILNKPDDKVNKPADSSGNTSSGDKPSLDKKKLSLEKKKESSEKKSNSTTSIRNYGEPKDWGILADYFFDR